MSCSATPAGVASVTKVVSIRLGIYLLVNKARVGWEAQIFYSYFVMSQLYETEIP